MTVDDDDDAEKKIYENVCCFLVLLLVMFLVYLFATLTFAKSSPLFDFGPRDDANSDVMKVRTKDPKDINLWIKRTDKFLEGKFLNRGGAFSLPYCVLELEFLCQGVIKFSNVNLSLISGTNSLT